MTNKRPTHALITRDDDGRTHTTACQSDTKGAIAVEVLDGFKDIADGPRFIDLEYQDFALSRRQMKHSYANRAGDNHYG